MVLQYIYIQIINIEAENVNVVTGFNELLNQWFQYRD